MKLTDKQIDKVLVLQCRSGQTAAFAELVERWHQKLCKQAYFHTKNIDLSKDIAQDCWTVIYTKLDQLKEPENFGSWALSIANRKAIDQLRSQAKLMEKLRRYQQSTTDLDLLEESKSDPTADGLEKEVLNALRNLPKLQQQVLRLFYVEQYTVFEISDLLRISKGTVKSRLFYAREKLKELIKNKRHEK